MPRRTGRSVVEPIEGRPPVPGVVYLGPRDLHIVFQDGAVLAVRGAKQHFTRPAVDPLFVSAAETFGARVIGVLLSGGGSDGVVGMIRTKEKGGLSLVQQPAEAPHPSMPNSALKQDHVDAALRSTTSCASIRIWPWAGESCSTGRSKGHSPSCPR